MKTKIIQKNRNQVIPLCENTEPEMHSYARWSGMVWWEKTRLLINTHSCGVPASYFSPPTQLSTLLTLDLHIKEPSLQKPSHMHRKIQGEGEWAEREEGRGERLQGRQRGWARPATLLPHTEVSSKTIQFQMHFASPDMTLDKTRRKHKK